MYTYLFELGSPTFLTITILNEELVSTVQIPALAYLLV